MATREHVSRALAVTPIALHIDANDMAHCTALLRAGSKSFSLASRLLPARVQPLATVLYAFCRVADDEVDLAPDGEVNAAVARLSARLDAVYNAPESSWRAMPAVDRALCQLVRAVRLPRLMLDALIEGMAWDAEGRRYETLDDLSAYGARVAGTVGAMMTLLMGGRDAEVLARACDLGVAMQLTNIARDVGEDARRGRIYLPLTWMREEGLSPEAWLLAPTFSPALGRVIARLLAAADELYARSSPGVALLPVDCRSSIRAASLIYRDIGRVIEERGYDSVGSRAVVSTWRKLWLFACALTARFERYRGEPTPPLPSTHFLVAAGCEGTHP